MATKEVKDKKATKQAAKPATKLVAKKVAQTKKTETVASTIKAEDKKVEKKRQTGLTVDMLSPTGDKKGTITLPEAIFNAKVNKPLMAQAVRVYLANQRSGSAHTKTRGEVDGSSKKIYKQKGTGNARHGSIRAPIFVGGGNVFGPRVRDYSLDLSKPMKKKSLASALTTKLQDGAVIVVADVSSLPLKTKEFAGMFKALDCDRSTLMLYGKEEATVGRAVRNLENVSYMPISQAHTYAVIHSKHIILTEQAVKELSNLVSS